MRGINVNHSSILIGEINVYQTSVLMRGIINVIQVF